MKPSASRILRPSRIAAVVLVALAVLGLAYLVYGHGELASPWAGSTDSTFRPVDVSIPVAGDLSVWVDAGDGRAVVTTDWGAVTLTMGW